MDANDIRKICEEADKAMSGGILRLAICNELIELAKDSVDCSVNHVLGRDSAMSPQTEEQLQRAFEWVNQNYEFIATTIRVAGSMIEDTINELDRADSVALMKIARTTCAPQLKMGSIKDLMAQGQKKSAHP